MKPVHYDMAEIEARARQSRAEQMEMLRRKASGKDKARKLELIRLQEDFSEAHIQAFLWLARNAAVIGADPQLMMAALEASITSLMINAANNLTADPQSGANFIVEVLNNAGTAAVDLLVNAQVAPGAHLSMFVTQGTEGGNA